PSANRGLVIIAPQRFEAELKPFVEHRRRSLPVEVAILETVLAKTPGVDDPEKLKRFLYTAWQKRKAHYVLLVGDATVLPVRYMVLDRVTPAAFDTAFYPSDLYYAERSQGRLAVPSQTEQSMSENSKELNDEFSTGSGVGKANP